MKRPSGPVAYLRPAAAFAAVLSLAACSQSGGAASASSSASGSGDTSADVAAITAQQTQWNQDWKARSLEPLVGHYAHDAVVMGPGMAPARGSDDIRAAVTQILTDPNFQLSFTTDKVKVAGSGDVAYTEGKYDESATDPKTHKVAHETGSYVTVYHKADNGDWKAVEDINTPGPAAS
jgi:uncharacterized protein (TIGR02246 family)